MKDPHSMIDWERYLDIFKGFAVTAFGVSGRVVFGEIPPGIPFAEIINYGNAVLDGVLTVAGIIYLTKKIKIINKQKSDKGLDGL